MNPNRVLAGSRFYLPSPYFGPTVLTFKLANSIEYQVKAAEISCFELIELPHCLRPLVVLHEFFGSHILLDSKADVVLMLEASNYGAQ